MATLGGGMAFEPGISVRIGAPPAVLDSEPARVSGVGMAQVKPGQGVDAGDPLANQPDDPTVPRVMSPFEATVTAVYRHKDEAGQRWTEIALTPTRAESPTVLAVPPPGRSATTAEWLAALNRLGPWRQPMLGADLPAQLYQAWQNRAEAVICVGLDAFSPYPVRSSLLESFPEDVAAGMQLLREAFRADRAEVLCGDDMFDAQPLRRACKRANVRCRLVDNVYPDADPTLVVHAYGRGGRRKRMLPHGANPATRGVVLIEPWHAVRIGRWLTNEAIDLARPYFVGWANPVMPMQARWAFAGQPLHQLAAALSGSPDELAERAIVGNPMTGRRVSALQDDAGRMLAPVTPDGEHLVALLTKPRQPEASPCVHCGWCADVCPTRLEPIRLAELATRRPEHPRVADRRQWCIDCGLCSHVCPSHIPLAQMIRDGG